MLNKNGPLFGPPQAKHMKSVLLQIVAAHWPGYFPSRISSRSVALGPGLSNGWEADTGQSVNHGDLSSLSPCIESETVYKPVLKDFVDSCPFPG